MTGHADEQGTRMAGLPDFDQRLVTSFHSAPEHVKRAICTLLNIEMADGEAQAQESPEGKHKHAARRDEESRVEEARTSERPSRAESINFRSIKNPEVPIHCIIQVNGGPPDGSLVTRDAGYSIRVTLDGGASRSPSIGLRFRHPGSEGPEVGRVGWHIDSRAEDRWVIQDLEYVLVSRAPHDKAVNHAMVINQCEGAKSLERLMCITLQVTPHAGGTCQRPARDTAEAIKMYFNAIFFKKKDYTLRIWFLKPWADRADLDTRCLSVMQYLFDQRQEPLSSAQDTTGAYFTNSTNAVRYGISAAVPQHQWDPWTDSFNPPQSVVPVEVGMSPTGGNASRRTAGTSVISRAYWGAAAASSGRAPLIAKRTGPATAAYPVKQPISDDEDGEIEEEDDEIKKEEGDAPATDRSPEGSEAKEEAEDSRSAQPARGMFSGTSAAGDKGARAHTGYYMRDGNEEDEGWKGNENSTPASPSRGLFSKSDSEAVETPPYWLDFEEGDEEEEQ